MNMNIVVLKPYQRLVLGLGIFDVLKSIATILGPFAIPSEPSKLDLIINGGENIKRARWAIGNRNTCRLDGFLFCVGSNGVHMYTLALCIYYVCKLNKKMTDEVFAEAIEKRMHRCIILLNFGLYIAAPFVDALNPSLSGTLCYPLAYPTGCRQFPFLECEGRSETSFVYFYIFNSFLVPMSCFIGICVCMMMLISHVVRRERIFGGFGSGSGSTGQSSTSPSPSPSSSQGRNVSASASGSFGGPKLQSKGDQDAAGNTNENVDAYADAYDTQKVNDKSNHEEFLDDDDAPEEQVGDTSSPAPTPTPTSIPPAEHSQQQQRQERERDLRNALSRLYKRELFIQALSYLLVFLVTTVPFSTLHAYCLQTDTKSFAVCSNPTFLRINNILFPLAGMFHIAIYMRPKVAYVRMKCPGITRWKAICLVLRSGGEVPPNLDKMNVGGRDRDHDYDHDHDHDHDHHGSNENGQGCTPEDESRRMGRPANRHHHDTNYGGRFPPRMERPHLNQSTMSNQPFGPGEIPSSQFYGSSEIQSSSTSQVSNAAVVSYDGISVGGGGGRRRSLNEDHVDEGDVDESISSSDGGRYYSSGIDHYMSFLEEETMVSVNDDQASSVYIDAVERVSDIENDEGNDNDNGHGIENNWC